MYATKKVRTISTAKKASMSRSMGHKDPTNTSVKANSNGDAHAEYITNAPRNVCHSLQ